MLQAYPESLADPVLVNRTSAKQKVNEGCDNSVSHTVSLWLTSRGNSVRSMRTRRWLIVRVHMKQALLVKIGSLQQDGMHQYELAIQINSAITDYSGSAKPNLKYRILFWTIWLPAMEQKKPSHYSQKQHNRSTGLFECNMSSLSICPPVERDHHTAAFNPALGKTSLKMLR